MGSLLNDIRYGARGLLKSPVFTLLAVTTMALGIGANTAIFSIINAVLLRPLPFIESERLVVPQGGKNDKVETSVLSYLDFSDWRAQTKTLEYITAYQRSGGLLRQNYGEPELITGANVDADLFPMLRVYPVVGNVFTRAQDQAGAAPVVVIGYNLWQRKFNSDPHIIGQQITIGNTSTTVIGVMPSDFRFPVTARQTDFLRPLAQALGEGTKRRSSYQLPVVARLKPDATVEQATAEMTVIAQNLEQQYPDEGFRLGARIITLHDATVGTLRTSLLVLLGAVGLVLLIACANVANLMLTRAATRHHEMAIRYALGASRWRVAQQLLTESLLLSTLGGIVGLLLGMWGVALLVAANPVNIPLLKDVGLDSTVFAFTAGISLLTGILFGLAPALSGSRVGMQEALKEGGRGGGDGRTGQRLRSILVVAEVAISLVLLIGAGLLIKSFTRLREVNPGFDPHNVLTTSLSLAKTKYPEAERQQQAFDEIVKRMAALPGVESAAVIHPLPFSGRTTANSLLIEGRPPVRPEDKPSANYRAVSNDYFKTMRVPVLRGRGFTEADTTKAPLVLIVNQSFASRFFGGAEVLGQRIVIERGDTDTAKQPSREIVGVVGDVRHNELDTEGGPELYVPYRQAAEPRMDLVVRTKVGDMTGIAASMREGIKQIDKEQYVPEVEPLTQLIAGTLAPRRFDALLTGLFAGVALLLATVGIFGVTAYAVTQRTREIGVRMALGAQRRDVLRLVLGEGLRLILAGIGAGLLASFALTRVLAGMLYGVKPTDPLTFIGISGALAAVALLACYLPARRATKVDPLVALRYE
ncbi:MAG TPA: ABC transporter permease [Pyrinomonadaceae bacterium]|nr:ABC transporter permease [Pyrinomonadaceae bacterium]